MMLNDYNAHERKNRPLARGVLDYFPDALLEVANLSRVGNEQHNPGQPLHWAKEKSQDEADALLRHLIDRGTIDTDGVRHSAKVAWRALALLQRELDAEAEAHAYLQTQTAPAVLGQVYSDELVMYTHVGDGDYIAENHRHDSGELPIPPSHYEGDFR
jgi:hypothetical protein